MSGRARLVMALAMLFSLGVAMAVASTQVVPVGSYAYDAIAPSRLEVHRIAPLELEQPLFSESQEDSISPATSARATSMSSSAPVIATKAGSVRNVNPLGGTANCVNCAVATDATLSGGPSSALNVRPGVTGQPISVLEDIYGGAFKSVSGQAQIEQMLLDGGPGSRGIVFGSRGADVPGHVFNAVNQNGVIRFLDGQTGGVASFKGYSGFEFLVTG